MSSDLVTYEWAAKRLNKSKRSIHNYIKRGFLIPVKDGVSSMLRLGDVESLAVEMGSDAPLITRKNLLAIQLRLKKLEEEMVTVKHILEIKDQTLRPDRAEAEGFLAAAKESLGRGNWGLDEIAVWAGQFEKMDEVSLDAFAAAASDGKAWTVFYQLCLKMMEAVSRQKGMESLALHRKLDEGRKKMRGTVLLWIELGRGSVASAVFDELDDPQESVLRRLTAS